MSHVPVMLNEVIAALQPKVGETYVDGTFGAGGYTRAILQAAGCKVIAIDRDPDAALRAKALQDVEIFVFERIGPEFEFQRRYDAERALLLPGFWQLEGVTENAPGVAPVRQKYLALPTTLAPETLLNRYASAKTIPFWQLPKFITETRRAGLEDDQYMMKFHSLMATPVLLTAMILIGAVVCLRQRRAGGVTQLIGMGAGAGFLLFFINQVAKGLAASGAAPPPVAAWSPPLFALFAVLAVIAFAEDG